MATVKVIFVRGNDDYLVDKVIAGVTKGEYVHVAIKMLGGIVESLGIYDKTAMLPGVRLGPADKYKNADIQIIEVDLPNRAAAVEKARSFLGRFYSYIGCIEGGLYDLFGLKLHPVISDFFNSIMKKLFKRNGFDASELTMNCSETVTRILRAGGFDILPGVDADCVTPMDLYKALI